MFSGNSTAGIEADAGAQVGVEHSTVNFNGTGLQANGTIWIDDTEISFNQTATAGTPVSFGNNRFYANVTPPASLASAGPNSTDRGRNATVTARRNWAADRRAVDGRRPKDVAFPVTVKVAGAGNVPTG